MNYEKISLFTHESRGTYDDFFDTDKYENMQDAYLASDYVKCDFVRNEKGTIYIECIHISEPDIKKYHRLDYQRPVFGIDISDDRMGEELAISMFK